MRATKAAELTTNGKLAAVYRSRAPRCTFAMNSQLGIAGDHHIGVIKTVVLDHSELHVIDVNTAGRAPGDGTKVKGNVQGDAIVLFAGIRHCINLTGQVFMTDVTQWLAIKVFLDRHVVLGQGKDHRFL